jgi:hypothetical protein
MVVKKYIKLGDMMLQALAAARFTNANPAVAAVTGKMSSPMGKDGVYAAELEEEEEEDAGEDPELM